MMMMVPGRTHNGHTNPWYPFWAWIVMMARTPCEMLNKNYMIPWWYPQKKPYLYHLYHYYRLHGNGWRSSQKGSLCHFLLSCMVHNEHPFYTSPVLALCSSITVNIYQLCKKHVPPSWKRTSKVVACATWADHPGCKMVYHSQVKMG